MVTQSTIKIDAVEGQELSSGASPTIDALWANVWPEYKYFEIINIFWWCN
jgi:hypothetical protein